MKNFIIKYIIFVFILILNCKFIYGEFLGEKYFNSKVEFYFTSSDVYLGNVSDKNVYEKFELIKEYDYYKNIELLKYLKNRKYAVAFNNEKNKSFCMIFKMKTSEYLNSNFYKNKNFEEENIQGVSTYYFLGDKEFIYTYINEEIYISNNISMFFEIMNNISYSKESLSQTKSFETIKPSNEKFEYFYYKKEKRNIKKYESEAFGIKKDGINIEKVYYIPNFKYNLNEKNYNFSEFIPNEIKEIHYSKNLEILKKNINENFDFITSSKTSLKGDTYTDISYEEIILKIKNSDEREYFILYFEGNMNSIMENIKNIYEKELFYNKRIEYLKDENDINLYYFEIPLFDKKIYIGIVKENYLIITEDKTVYEDIKLGKYYNLDYVNISNKSEYYENFITKEKMYLEYGNDYIKEIY